MNKRVIIGIIALIAIVVLVIFAVNKGSEKPQVATSTPETTPTEVPNEGTIGTSVEGRAIKSYVYGEGERHIAFVGGIHGGYEWNSVLLSYELMDYLDANPDAIPENVRVSVIPVANPDGLHRIMGTTTRFAAAEAPGKEATVPGRFNANEVDLNRNFDCNWAPKAVWRGNDVSAGSKPFSEPEARALRDFALETKPDLIVFYHSAASAVYASACGDGVAPKTADYMNTYAKASGYPAHESFDAYEITGDSGDWLATIGVPSISVELTTHEVVEWDRNLAGIKAVLEHAAKLPENEMAK